MSQNKLGVSIIGVLVSFAAGTAVILALLLLSAVLIDREVLPEEMGKLYIIVSAVAGAAAASALLSGTMASKRVLAAGIVTMVLIVALIVAALVLGGGQASFASLWYQMLSILVGSITGCIIRPIRHQSKRR